MNQILNCYCSAQIFELSHISLFNMFGPPRHICSYDRPGIAVQNREVSSVIYLNDSPAVAEFIDTLCSRRQICFGTRRILIGWVFAARSIQETRKLIAYSRCRSNEIPVTRT
jgi:hypothetical protein